MPEKKISLDLKTLIGLATILLSIAGAYYGLKSDIRHVEDTIRWYHGDR